MDDVMRALDSFVYDVGLTARRDERMPASSVTAAEVTTPLKDAADDTFAKRTVVDTEYLRGTASSRREPTVDAEPSPARRRAVSE